MRVISLFLFTILYASCNSVTVDTKNASIAAISSKWDSSTVKALEEIKESNNPLSNKAMILKSSFLSDSSKVNFLSRADFIASTKNQLDSLNTSKGLIIIELAESGEAITSKKAVIEVATKRIRSFSLNNNNEWIYNSSSILTNDQIDFVRNVETAEETDNYLWGYGINDVLVISEINGSNVTAKPILLLDSKTITSLRKLLSESISNSENHL